MLLPFCASAQTPGYNPTNPADPNWPEDSQKKYKVICEAIPGGANTFDVREYVEGKRVTISAYDNRDCKFEGWFDAANNELTTDHTYSFTMPAHDVKFYAHYTYKPSNPNDPYHVNQYTLTLVSDPLTAASFNFTSKKVNEASTVGVYSYANSGFKFIKWVDQDGFEVSTKQYMDFVMPSRNTTLTAKYVYDPETPFNPATNLWDESSGLLEMDCFTPGYLTYGMETKIGGIDNASKVTHLLVDGVMESNDWGFTYYFRKLTYVDMSRVTGVTAVNYAAFDAYTDLQEIEIPSCITQIQEYAFRNCAMLRAFNCYALVPPVVRQSAFEGVPSTMVVYVPETSIDLYKNADGWKEFDIQPIRNKMCALEVSLPAECADGRYKNMILELVNQKNGQRMRYVVTDRINYTFNNLIRNTVWNAYLKNSSEEVIGDIKDIEIAEDRQSITFSALKKLQTVNVSVVTSLGAKVYTGWNALWYSESGEKLPTEGASLTAQVPGKNVKMDIVLGQQLAKVYEKPQSLTYTIVDQSNGINEVEIAISEIPSYNVSLKFVDNMTNLPVAGVSVVATQEIGGYLETVTATSDATGAAILKVRKNGTVTLNYTCDQYLSGSIKITEDEIAESAVDGVYAVGTVKVRPATGMVGNIQFTYTPSAIEGETAETLSEYPEYKNVSYTLYNKTQGKEITEFDLQYPRIIIYGGATYGDVIEATAVSNESKAPFNAVVCTATVNDNGYADFRFPIVQRGGLFARFLVTDNKQVVGALYDNAGGLMSRNIYNTNFEAYSSWFGDDIKHNYTPNFIYLQELADGDYTLITMGNSNYVETPNQLYLYDDLKLVAGTDYVRNDFTVSSGKITSLRNVVIPVFKEDKFYFTGENTSFTSNKSTAIAGNYISLNAKVDFLDEYKTGVSDVKLVVKLPVNCDMVEGSAMLGKNLTSYEYKDATVTIPLGENYTDRAKFVIVPSYHGNYTVSGFVSFKLNGEDMLQPIGNVQYVVSDLTLWTPSLVSKPAIIINGNAPANSTVDVYDRQGNHLLGKTTALANGYWMLDTKLVKPANLSMHEIYAKITTPAGAVMQTPVSNVQYNEDFIQGKTVEMKYWCGTHTVDLTWDLEHWTTTATSYPFTPNKEFSFIMDLTNNDPAVAKKVTLHVLTINNEWVDLPGQYVPNMGKWFAHGTFSTSMAPVGVYVSVISDLSSAIELGDAKASMRKVDEAFEAQIAIDSYQPAEVVPEDLPEADDLTGAQADEMAQAVEDNANQPAVGEVVIEQEKQTDAVEFETAEGDTYQVQLVDADQADDVAAQYDEAMEVPVTQSEGYQELAGAKGASASGSGIMVYSSSSDGGIAVKVPSADQLITYVCKKINKKAGAPKNSPLATSIINDIQDSKDNIQASLSQGISTFENSRSLLESDIALTNIALGKANTLISYYQSIIDNPSSTPAEVAAAQGKQATAIANHGKLQTKLAKDQAALTNVKNTLGIMNALAEQTKHANAAMGDIKDWGDLVDAIAKCSGPDIAQAKGLEAIARGKMEDEGKAYDNVFKLASLSAALAAASKTDKDTGFKVSAMPAALGAIGALLAEGLYQSAKAESDNDFNDIVSDFNALDCAVPDFPARVEIGKESPKVTPIIDPSGFVYEGVSSNRVEGVTATAYYKKTYEDMYGDLHEDVVLWDAEQYNQKNPLLTDAEGMYSWDVPQGLWQVKFEKEGYETTYSEWLPVPPPQLEVNVPIVRNAQPEVIGARAFANDSQAVSEVEIAFSNYMKPELLNTDNIFIKVVKDGNATLISDATISMGNLEPAVEGSDKMYASVIKVATGGVDLAAYDEVHAIVSSRVESYSGIQMRETYDQLLDIEKRIERFVVSDTVNVAYEGSETLVIGALPAQAAAGRKVRLTSANTVIVTLGEQAAESLELTLDENGRAEVALAGQLLGTTALKIELVNDNLEKMTLVNVVDPALLETVKAPVASRLSGTQVYRGQTVTLACETKGATIYYTTDGSCPCDPAKRMVYSNPIVIDDVMTLKVMAVGYTGEESEIVTYSYGIRQAEVTMALAAGWNWCSHDAALPLTVDAFDGKVQAVLTQNAEAVADPELGLVGSLQSVEASEAMKIKVAEPVVIAMQGEQYNPMANEVKFHAGWNWLGYPVSTTLSVADALQYLSAEEGDVIETLSEGFATYSNSQWVGSLQTMKPGVGYLYKSKSEKAMVYNTLSAGNAKSLYGHSLETNVGPWTTDTHRYPNMMPVVATIAEDGAVADGTWFVGAFCGDECRGFGTYSDGILFLSIYGEGQETITFKAVSAAGDDVLTFAQSVPFEADMLGSVGAPYVLDLGATTGITDIATGMTPEAIYTISGIRVSKSAANGIYIIQSKDKDGHSVVRKMKR